MDRGMEGAHFHTQAHFALAHLSCGSVFLLSRHVPETGRILHNAYIQVYKYPGIGRKKHYTSESLNIRYHLSHTGSGG